jgi:GT2 family glycosyltransferase
LLSIVIPARNNAAFTRECLASATQSLSGLDLKAQFVLIDDASDPEERMLDLFKEIRARTPGHQFIIARTKRHLHYTRVFSLGVHLTQHERVFFLSNDMLVTPHFLAAVLAVAALDSNFGIVRGTSNYTDSLPQHTVPFPMPMRTYQDVMNFSRAIFDMRVLSIAEDEVLSGDAVLISRALIDRIGVPDYRFFGYFGDVDYGMRAHLAGFKLVCAKGAWLWHKGAGYIKAQAKLDKIELAKAMRRRMEVVESAYQEFRNKWGDPSLPATYPNDKRLTASLFPMAERNAGRVALKYEFPATAVQDFDLV